MLSADARAPRIAFVPAGKPWWEERMLLDEHRDDVRRAEAEFFR